MRLSDTFLSSSLLLLWTIKLKKKTTRCRDALTANFISIYSNVSKQVNCLPIIHQPSLLYLLQKAEHSASRSDTGNGVGLCYFVFAIRFNLIKQLKIYEETIFTFADKSFGGTRAEGLQFSMRPMVWKSLSGGFFVVVVIFLCLVGALVLGTVHRGNFKYIGWSWFFF